MAIDPKDKSQSNNPNPSNPSGGGKVRNSSSDQLSASRSEAGGASGEKNFRCADVGFTECKWEASGRTEAELWPKIEQHGREAHGIEQIDAATRSKVQGAIQEKRAA